MKCEHCSSEGQLGVVCAVCETTCVRAVVEILELFVSDWENGSRGHHWEIEARLRALAGLPQRELPGESWLAPVQQLDAVARYRNSLDHAREEAGQ